MIRMLSLATLAAGALVAPAALAHGDIGTIARGTYVCELPGNAATGPGVPQPQENFRIRSASRYSSPQGDGVYLRRGERVTMTSGPRNGDSYIIERSGFLRKLHNGSATRLRCILQDG